MIRLRKVSLLNDIRKNRAPLFYWSLGAGFITTASVITFGYFYYSYRIRQRTKEGIKKGEVERIISTEGLTSQELEKAIDLLQKQRIHEQIQIDNFERYKKLHMFTYSTTKISNEHVNHIVTSILNKKQQNLLEQQQTFIRRNTDENNKRNNYLVDKFTSKKRTISSKENVLNPITKLISPKKKVSIEINDDDDDDDDFIATRKRPKVIYQSKINSILRKNDPIKECLESIIIQIENNDITCPICNQVLSNLSTIDQRQQHVNRCLEEPQIINIEPKHQKTLVSYTKPSSTIRKPTTITTLSNFKCQICGMSFHVKHTYLSHLKKCSNQNSVQLKHVVNFAAKTTTNIKESKSISTIKKQIGTNIKNRIIKMEIPKTEDDEQQQLAIALSTSIKTALEPPNAFDILQAASKKTKTIDLLTVPLWNVSMEDKLKLCSIRLSDLCERLITIIPSENAYKFPLSSLQAVSQTNFGHVNWWNITTTDPHDDEIPMTQLARILNDNDDDDELMA
ncbi:unnamed protein product [Rotaria sordida]|uniref:Uncharacterized protein n=1 Tax=Rotaria sordida TaxID=392033 RepID=A0A815DIH2_9BILA|nr:unnamed protein product [Rotaria sordida]CAF1569258.1 unnamed protein product [Rotaria sordida]